MAFVDPDTKRVFLTTTEVAKRWGVHPAVITNFHTKVGGLSGTPVGRMVLFAANDLAAYEERRKKDLDGKIRRLKKLRARMDRPITADVDD